MFGAEARDCRYCVFYKLSLLNLKPVLSLCYEGSVSVKGFTGKGYNPGGGVWLSGDPIKDGSDWWAYCGNDPVNYVDPLGLEWVRDPSRIGAPWIWKVDLKNINPNYSPYGNVAINPVTKTNKEEKNQSYGRDLSIRLCL